MGFIEELYYGNINPNEKRYTLSVKYEKAIKTLCDNKEKLSKELSGEQLKLFNELLNASDIISSTTAVENFKIGFRLGVQMMFDSLVIDKNNILKEVNIGGIEQ